LENHTGNPAPWHRNPNKATSPLYHMGRSTRKKVKAGGSEEKTIRTDTTTSFKTGKEAIENDADEKKREKPSSRPFRKRTGRHKQQYSKGFTRAHRPSSKQKRSFATGTKSFWRKYSARKRKL